MDNNTFSLKPKGKNNSKYTKLEVFHQQQICNRVKWLKNGFSFRH